MGRTLHFNITKDEGENFTRKELEHIHNTSEFYNSDDLLNSINKAHKVNLKELWSCENFWLSPVGFCPNWNFPLFRNKEADFIWNIINNEEARLEAKGLHYFDVVEKLVKTGMVEYEGDGLKTKTIRGFTKTQGNEFNSLLVLKALITISKLVSNATIYIYDEGEYLLCPLHIKKGRALPLIEKMKEAMESYALRLILAEKSKYNIIPKLKHAKDFTEIFRRDLGLNNNYGELDIKHIDNKLRNLKLIEKALLETGITKDGDHKLYHYNIANLPLEKWFDPEIFTRKVVAENFLGYKMGVDVIMDGINGEGFGLTDEDSEKKSYEMLAKINQLLGMNDNNSNLKLRILGED